MRKFFFGPFYLSENPPLKSITVIYEHTQVNGQLHLSSVGQMEREYSKTSGKAKIIRSVRLMCLSVLEQMKLNSVFNGW